jgi:DNA-directed RNA polymerase subunit beta'
VSPFQRATNAALNTLIPDVEVGLAETEMSNILDPQRAMKALEDGTVEEIKAFFPIVGKRHTLTATDVYTGDKTDIDDIASQKKARLRNRTWAQSVYGDFKLTDNATGKVLDTSRRTKIASLPKLTRRYSFIIDGTEYQADNQWRLRSGVYTRRKANGELESQFNLSRGRGFRMGFDPVKRRFLMTYGTTNVQLYPVLRALDVSDAEIESKWGEALLSEGKRTQRKGELVKLAKALNPRAEATTYEDAVTVVKEALAATEINPETTRITLGTPVKSVTATALLRASNKLLRVNRGEEQVDNRDSLRFKELWSVSDHIPERLQNSARRINFKIANNLDRKSSIRQIVTPDVFGVPIKAFFTSTALSQQPSQLNPVDMVGGFLRTTIMGTGGIQSEQAITDDAKLIDSSFLGFVDPVHTPEGKRSGVSAHLALGVDKDGLMPTIRLYDMAAKKFVSRSPAELAGKSVAFPDQYDFGQEGPPKPLKSMVTVIREDGGDTEVVEAKEVDYVLQSPKQLFSMTANMIPFLASDQANRAGMATRHMEQAISLKNREAPLVQTVSGNPKSRFNTWEKIMGAYSAHVTDVAGTVVSVSSTRIVVRDKGGKTHDVPLYENFPLNEKKAMLHSAPLVKKGDTVTAGQVVADTNFTSGGTLALGTNIRIAYLPYKGLVFEDGIVISESASKKLVSTHLHKKRAYVEKNMGVGLKRFRANFPGRVSDDNAAKLDADGVIKKGQTVGPGDVLMTVLQKTEPSREQILLRGIGKSLVRPYKDRSVTWAKPYVGTVTDVVRNGREIMVYIRTEEAADIGDKLSGRHGNKGVITAILPDEEMPRDSSGDPVHIIMNPSGVPSRINLGQILETSLAKVAYKDGQPIAVDNFQKNDSKKIVRVKEHYRTIKTREGIKRVKVKAHEREVGYQQMVVQTLKEAGISETEELFDAATGKSLGQVLVGRQYILKLVHQIDKKLRARAHGYGQDYDANLIPKGAGETGAAQRFGELGLYAMLSHGAVHNIRDALTYKGDKQQDEVWTAIQTGAILPSPKPSFAYEKFLGYMHALGLNVEKEGSELIVGPMTDAQIKALSNGELKNANKVVRGKDLKPEKGGLFDESITGGPGGKNWSHISLAEPLPNPLFEKSIRALLHLTGKEYDSIIAGKAGLDAAGNVVAVGAGVKTGPAAIVAALGTINVKKALASAEETVKTARKGELDKANKKVKYLRMLAKNKLPADEAYVLSKVPVLPPVFRPITVMEGGDLNIDGINLLYRDMALLNGQLRQASGVLPDEEVAQLREDLYEAMDALIGTSAPKQGILTQDGQIRPPGILSILSGRTSPKQSFFHQKLMDKKQDLTMRSVITPDMDLHLDEVGLPRKGAMKIYRPFVIRELVRMGYTPLKAREEVEGSTSLANKALDIAVNKRPVLFKRDPVLHKFGIMAFRPKLHDSAAIHIHPLVTGGFNADFDGDAMSIFVPVSQEAVDEAYRMMPSKNLFNPATGRVMYQPSLEGQLGLFLLTQFGRKTRQKFLTEDRAVQAAKSGDIMMTDIISVGKVRTTAGRILFRNTLPKKIRQDDQLTDPDLVMGSKNLQAVLRRLAKEAPAEFAPAVDRIKDLGFGHAYNIGFSFQLSDFTALKELRDKHMRPARTTEAGVRKMMSSGRLSRKAGDARIVALYTKVTKEMSADAQKLLTKRGNKLYAMNRAGVKPKWNQLQQMVLGPMLLENAKGRVIPVPVARSYAEGLGTAGYWVASSGARKGLIEKVVAVQKPGALNKQIANTTISYIVTQDDCGTEKGVALDVASPDLVDRYTAKAIRFGGGVVPKNTLITPSLLSKMKAGKVSKVLARSALKCSAPKGLCAKCYGANESGRPIEKGTNIGLLAGAAIGERGTQLAMRVFHSGGVAGAGGGVSGSGIDRVIQVLKMPSVLPGAATLAPVSGKVKSVKKSPVGGYDVTVGSVQSYIPSGRGLLVKKGVQVKKGQPLSVGPIDPRDLLEKTNIDVVQRYLTDEVSKVYSGEGVRRRNVEVVIKALTNLGVVEDAGGSDKFVRGDYISLSHAASLNKSSTTPIRVKPVLRGIETLPLDQSTDWVARLQYRKLRETLTRAANEGWKSDIHGLHPSPGLAYGAEFGRGGKGGPY